MNRVYLILLAILIASALNAQRKQDKKVAVFDPDCNDYTIKNNTAKTIIREEISTIIVRSKGFTVLERALINKVLEENKFQMSDLVDEAQISELGKMMGANYVFVTSMTPMGSSDYYLSFKLIEVATAKIEDQRTATTGSISGPGGDVNNNLIRTVKKTVPGMFNGDGGDGSIIDVNKQLIANGKKIYKNSELLDKVTIRTLMTNSESKALKLYNRSRTSNGLGNLFIWTGIISTGVTVYGGIQYKSIPDYNMILYSCIGGSALQIALGTICIINSRNLVKRSVEKYNKGTFKSMSSLDFNIKGNGFGLALTF